MKEQLTGTPKELPFKNEGSSTILIDGFKDIRVVKVSGCFGVTSSGFNSRLLNVHMLHDAASFASAVY